MRFWVLQLCFYYRVIMPTKNILTALKSTKVFPSLSPEDWDALLKVSKFIKLAPHEILAVEGHWDNYFFVVLSGHLKEIERTRIKKKLAHQSIGKGAMIEEAKLLHKSSEPHSHSGIIMAKEATTVLAIPIDWFNSMANSSKNFHQALLDVAAFAASELRRVDFAYIALFKRFLKLSDHIIYILGLLSIFIFFIPWVKQLEVNSEYPLTFIALLNALMGIAIAISSRWSGLHWADLGVSRQQLIKKMLMAVLFSMPVLIFGLLLKQLIIVFYPSFNAHTFIGLGAFPHLTASKIAYGLIIYSIYSFTQEFIARGCLQGPLSILLSGRHIKLKAMIMSNIIFSGFHVTYSLHFALMSLIPGFFWGWLYVKQRNVFSVSLSHVFLGVGFGLLL